MASVRSDPGSGFGEQFNPDQKEIVGVHRKHIDGRATDRCYADNVGTFQQKMFDPRVGPRVEQPGKLAGSRIETGNIRTLESIAVRTRQCEIALLGLASVLLGKNVIYLKWQWEGKLRDQTVLAPIGSPLPDDSGKAPIHGATAFSFFKRLLARDCTTARRLPMCK